MLASPRPARGRPGSAGRVGVRETARNGVASGVAAHCRCRFIQPSSVDLHAGRAALHEVLRVEVRARRVGAADRVDRGEGAVLPQRQERLERRMQAEVAVEVEGGVLAAAARRGQRRWSAGGGGRRSSPYGDDHVQAVAARRAGTRPPASSCGVARLRPRRPNAPAPAAPTPNATRARPDDFRKKRRVTIGLSPLELGRAEDEPGHPRRVQTAARFGVQGPARGSDRPGGHELLRGQAARRRSDTPRTRPPARSSAKLRRASRPLVETHASAVSL